MVDCTFAFIPPSPGARQGATADQPEITEHPDLKTRYPAGLLSVI